ncbi:hypothetical protein CYJ10_32005 [Cupriavidus pauculus]|uniref:DUF4148 domain-containing protein n=1 Tax=Cupriavidus pauculus TaxID=82633 RepID=A0A2N5C2J2_9BURK|nr:hypothetical protein CYJ10_32005 [Cupriavidus pauculus]
MCATCPGTLVTASVRLENAGYRSGPGESNYPADLQAAEAKIAAQQGIEAPKAPLSRGTVRQ